MSYSPYFKIKNKNKRNPNFYPSSSSSHYQATDRVLPSHLMPPALAPSPPPCPSSSSRHHCRPRAIERVSLSQLLHNLFVGLLGHPIAGHCRHQPILVMFCLAFSLCFWSFGNSLFLSLSLSLFFSRYLSQFKMQISPSY